MKIPLGMQHDGIKSIVDLRDSGVGILDVLEVYTEHDDLNGLIEIADMINSYMFELIREVHREESMWQN